MSVKATFYTCVNMMWMSDVSSQLVPKQLMDEEVIVKESKRTK